jgi:glycosyltransferase involved in cell wall biosynthesis
VLAPRGEFAASALAIKARKKTLFLSAAKGVGLHATVLWQASSAQEEQDILRMRAGIGRGIGVAINLPPAAGQLEDFNPPRRDPSKPLSVCFLSRITPMKNLDFALRVLGQVRAPVIFSIYGPIRDEPYWAECRTLVESLPPTVQVLYQGTVEHDRVGAVLEAHDLFFLPTRGENYGHVILEALSAGLPVLIADTTPWHGLADAGAGWDLPLTDEGAFAAKIDEVAALDPETHGAMRRHAAALAGKHLDAAGPIRSNRDLFLAACQSGRQSGNSA